MDEVASIESALDAVGPRLKWLRGQRGMTLDDVSEATGISKSTMSRLETGQRRPSLELPRSAIHGSAAPTVAPRTFSVCSAVRASVLTFGLARMSLDE